MTTNFTTQKLSNSKKIIEECKKEIIENLKKDPKCERFIPMIEQNEIYDNILKDMKIKNYIFTIHNDNNPEIIHDKYKTDNIIKKVFVFFFTCLIDKINSIIYNIEGNQKYKIELKYEFKSRLKKDIYLLLLDTTIKDLLIKENCGSENDKIILTFLEKNAPILNYIFNLTFKEWIEFAQMKKKPKIEIFQTDELYSLLEKKFEENNEDQQYFCNFVFCFYFFDKWFNSIKGRNSNK